MEYIHVVIEPNAKKFIDGKDDQQFTRHRKDKLRMYFKNLYLRYSI